MSQRKLGSAFYTWITLCVLFNSFDAFARAGGGSNGRVGFGGLLLYVIGGLPLLIVILSYAIYINSKIDSKARKCEALLDRLVKLDPIWNKETLHQFVRTTFFQVQNAWCNQDVDTLKKLLSPGLLKEWLEQINATRSKNQRNVMDNLALDNVRFVLVKNYRDDCKDLFTVCLDAQATDYTVNHEGDIVDSNRAFVLSERQAITKQQGAFLEFWTFVRDDKSWRLFQIDTLSNWKKSVETALLDEEEAQSR